MKNNVARSTLFLTELVINLLIFAVCAAVCVGLLVKAYGISRESGDLTNAVYLAQSAAEALRCGQTPQAAAGGYDIAWEIEEDGGLSAARITVSRDEREVYALRAAWAEETDQ